MNEDEFAAMTGTDAQEGLPVEQDTEALLEAADMEEAGEAGFEDSAAPDAESGAGGHGRPAGAQKGHDGFSCDAVTGEAASGSYRDADFTDCCSPGAGGHGRTDRTAGPDGVEDADGAVPSGTAAPGQAANAAALPPAGGVNSSPRDYAAEVSGLLAAYPELRGKSLPEEVIAQCVDSGRSLTAAYTGWLMESINRELKELRAENETLRQNASAAVRAPVRAALSGGSPGGGGSDPFLSGFDADY